jgi:hypothetical protein
MLSVCTDQTCSILIEHVLQRKVRACPSQVRIKRHTSPCTLDVGCVMHLDVDVRCVMHLDVDVRCVMHLDVDVRCVMHLDVDVWCVMFSRDLKVLTTSTQGVHGKDTSCARFHALNCFLALVVRAVELTLSNCKSVYYVNSCFVLSESCLRMQRRRVWLLTCN